MNIKEILKDQTHAILDNIVRTAKYISQFTNIEYIGEVEFDGVTYKKFDFVWVTKNLSKFEGYENDVYKDVDINLEIKSGDLTINIDNLRVSVRYPVDEDYNVYGTEFTCITQKTFSEERRIYIWVDVKDKLFELGKKLDIDMYKLVLSEIPDITLEEIESYNEE